MLRNKLVGLTHISTINGGYWICDDSVSNIIELNAHGIDYIRTNFIAADGTRCNRIEIYRGL